MDSALRKRKIRYAFVGGSALILLAMAVLINDTFGTLGGGRAYWEDHFELSLIFVFVPLTVVVILSLMIAEISEQSRRHLWLSILLGALLGIPFGIVAIQVVFAVTYTIFTHPTELYEWLF